MSQSESEFEMRDQNGFDNESLFLKSENKGISNQNQKQNMKKVS